MTKAPLPPKEEWQDVFEDTHADGHLKLVAARTMLRRMNDIIEDIFNGDQGCLNEFHELVIVGMDSVSEADDLFSKTYHIGVQAEMERRKLSAG